MIIIKDTFRQRKKSKELAQRREEQELISHILGASNSSKEKEKE
tara:strand:+ start:257 stop:388 length:132 start_codon:yes stop_codon:yes gene_type:complete